MTAAYTFDAVGPAATFSDASGRGHHLQALTRNGAALHTITHGAGKAVKFPPGCTGRRCPRLALHAASTPALNPAARPIRYGATVKLAPGQTSDGQNVLQKGYSTTGGQYKLQVDKLPGHPSCAMTSEDSPTIHLATSRATVADGAWHVLECRRSGTTLTILVDGRVRAATSVPAGLTVDNTAPLVLGGKGLSLDSDPFQGALDDAWISIS
ncbi:LamG-like jellyroll fold domain-containing protein [Actinoplanes sp. GCM10030250]|uniref:LamG-like jellyroll fold domain-containing protein n=1 Tax=Actinoplanes sp. GCM10030250 TaxID=3273376 RepID=UPI003615BB55